MTKANATYVAMDEVIAVQTDLIKEMEASPHGAVDALAFAISDPIGSRFEADRLPNLEHTYMKVDVGLGLLQAATVLVAGQAHRRFSDPE